MVGSAYAAWMKASFDAWALGAESATVAGMRVAKIAAGGSPAATEAALMISEKVQAGLELQASLVASGLALTPLAGTQTALRLYRKKVAANRRRLSR